jgi:hypothetical protein
LQKNDFWGWVMVMVRRNIAVEDLELRQQHDLATLKWTYEGNTEQEERKKNSQIDPLTSDDEEKSFPMMPRASGQSRTSH